MKQKLNEALLSLIPPVVRKYSMRLTYARNMTKRLRINSYDSSEIAKVVAEKTKLSLMYQKVQPVSEAHLSTLIAAILLGITRTGKSQIALLEFGGGAGNHFHLLPTEIQKYISVWVVLETPEMVIECKQFENKILKFTSSNREWKSYSENIDLVYSSCAIQYSVDPLDQLNRLLESKPSVVCLNRIALTTETKQVEISEFSQILGNGPEVSGYIGQPNQIVKYVSRAMVKSEFENKLNSNYKTVSLIEDGPTAAQKAAGKINVGLYSYLAILNQN